LLVTEVIMGDKFWWDTNKDDGFINSILKFSVEARMFYLKTDVKVRLKHFIMRNADFDEIIYLWKRLAIIKKNFGEEAGGMIIREAVREVQDEFNESDWQKIVQEKIEQERNTLNDNFVREI